MVWNTEEIREAFPILKQTVRGKRLVFLDSTASAQKPQVVIDAIKSVFETAYANVHRGIYGLAEAATERYEAARVKIAGFIHAPEPAEVIYVRNATEALNLIAYAWGRDNIVAGDRIVITEMEQHSNLVPWMQLAREKGAELAYLPVTDAGELDLAPLPDLLKDGRTKVVAFTLMSNVLGAVPPAKEIIEQAKAAGALVVLDGAQAVPHIPVDVQDLGADFMAFSAHKLCGPGIGALWGRRPLLEKMPPFLYGGDMILSVSKHDAIWNEIPYKFEAGTPPIAEAAGFGAAIDFLSTLGMEAVHAHEQDIIAYAMERLSEITGLHILGPEASKRGGVVSFWMDGIHPHDTASLLDEQGIAIRAGLHCAEPLHTRFGLKASSRASFYIYNDRDDVEALVDGLAYVKKVLRR
ncbi:MAG: SufS family cysteine desulfurase [Anaerolineae bacterium]|nr:SufS family cysteine desulfurase [Anaerolineae bacterium]